jgi:hypothetical protein
LIASLLYSAAQTDSLECLRLGSNDVTDAGAGVLFSVLARSDKASVRDVDLSWNHLRGQRVFSSHAP